MGRSSPESATPRGYGLPAAAAAQLEAAGFNVAGALAIDDYDTRVPPPWRSDLAAPGARRAIVLGTGGGGFERAWLEAAAGQGGLDPADDFAADVLARVTRSIEAASGGVARAWLYADRRSDSGGAPVFADFVALAEACGLGVRGRLGLLLHPVYGPWWSVRGLVLTSLDGPVRVAADSSTTASADAPPAASPCLDCTAPCISACPGGAVSAEGFDAAACARTRRAGVTCGERCDARRACVVGPAHAYDAAAEAHYARSSLAWLQRASSASGDSGE